MESLVFHVFCTDLFTVYSINLLYYITLFRLYGHPPIWYILPLPSFHWFIDYTGILGRDVFFPQKWGPQRLWVPSSRCLQRAVHISDGSTATKKQRYIAWFEAPTLLVAAGPISYQLVCTKSVYFIRVQGNSIIRHSMPFPEARGV